MLKSKASWALSIVAAGVTGFRGTRLIQTLDCIDADVETTRSSRLIRKQPVQTWFVYTTEDGLALRSSEIPHETQSWRLSLRADGHAAGRSGPASRRHKIGARRTRPRSIPGH